MALTHHAGLAVTGTATFGGSVTATGTGKTTALNALSVAATTTLLGKVVGDASWCGVRAIATGGSATISCPSTASSAIIAIPEFKATSGTAVRRRVATVVNRTTTTFKVLLNSPTGTVAAGTVSWMVINV